MINLIKVPCLPKGNVNHCLIGERFINEISELKAFGIECLTLKPGFCLEEEINNHADILSFNFGNGQVILNKDSIGENVLKTLCINPVYYDKKLNSPYPNDIPMNVAFTGKHIICNSNYASKDIINFAKNNNIEIIHTNQGYTKCNLCIVNNKAVITEDVGLAYLLKFYQYDVLLISIGDIYLSEAHYGFIGGASCKISPNKMYFSGDLSRHRDYQSINNFLKSYNVEPIYNSSRRLTDFGGIVQLTEKIT